MSPRKNAPGGNEAAARAGSTEDESGSSEPEAATFTFTGILSPKKDAQSRQLHESQAEKSQKGLRHAETALQGFCFLPEVSSRYECLLPGLALQQ